jgi:hypothetical protein
MVLMAYTEFTLLYVGRSYVTWFAKLTRTQHPSLSPADTWRSLFNDDVPSAPEEPSFYSYFTTFAYTADEDSGRGRCELLIKYIS